jgi:hypothetical protein
MAGLTVAGKIHDTRGEKSDRIRGEDPGSRQLSKEHDCSVERHSLEDDG